MTFLRFCIFPFLIATLTAPSALAAAPRFFTQKVDGRNYVPLERFAEFYGFSRNWTRNQRVITLKKKYATLRIKIDSREATLIKNKRDVSIWLNFEPIQSGPNILIAELDVIKTFDPVLRPWVVPESAIETIMIDPGHGGFDTGTRGATEGIVEKTYSLDTSKRLERRLKDAGFRTLLTRRTDEYVSLEDRADQASVSSADLFVSIHFNSARPDREPNGPETFCLTPAGAASTGDSDTRIADFQINPANNKDSQNMLLAYCVHDSLVSNMPEVNDRGVKRARFVVIRENKKPSVLIECGFLSNPREERRIRDPNYREQLADAIYKGILKYVGYVTPRQKASPGPIRLR